MCTRQEVKEEIITALKDNNIIRDRMWKDRNDLIISNMELALEKKISDLEVLYDKRYAIKLIETIVFGMCGVLLLGILGALLSLVIKQ
jgi:hypothetical protein